MPLTTGPIHFVFCLCRSVAYCTTFIPLSKAVKLRLAITLVTSIHTLPYIKILDWAQLSGATRDMNRARDGDRNKSSIRPFMIVSWLMRLNTSHLINNSEF